MSITKEYLSELEELISTSETYPDRINNWERDFLASISVKLGTYAEESKFSDRQLETIEKISKKVYSLT